jgi:tyrosinase
MLPLADARPAAAQQAGFVRRDLGQLVSEQSPLVETYRRGVAEMMRRPQTDPTSWWFQAAIHDLSDQDLATVPANLRHLTQQCPHGNYFFFAWHRIYLYYFERIVRAAAQEPTFALPYWNYEDPAQRSLPEPFRPVNGQENPLAPARARSALIDQALFGLGDSAVNTNEALLNVSFASDPDGPPSFGGFRVQDHRERIQPGLLEAQPHDIVHGLIGIQDGIAEGWMSSTQTAARDPIFWLHHTNLDRLWVKWINLGGGRRDPVDESQFMERSFTFVDENGQEVTRRVAEFLDTQLQLGYRYDDDPAREVPLYVAEAGSGTRVALRPLATVVTAASGTTIVGRSAGPVELAPRQIQSRLTKTMTPPAGAAHGAAPSVAAAAASSSEGPVVLVLDDVRVPNPPATYFEVYLNKPEDQPAEPTGPYFAGVMTFFSVGQHGGHSGSGARFTFDVTSILARQAALAPGAGTAPTVTFVRRGLSDSTGGEYLPDEEPLPTIGEVRLEIRSAPGLP